MYSAGKISLHSVGKKKLYMYNLHKFLAYCSRQKHFFWILFQTKRSLYSDSG